MIIDPSWISRGHVRSRGISESFPDGRNSRTRFSIHVHCTVLYQTSAYIYNIYGFDWPERACPGDSIIRLMVQYLYVYNMSNYDRRTDYGEISISHRRIYCTQYYDDWPSVFCRGPRFVEYVYVRGRFNYAIIRP